MQRPARRSRLSTAHEAVDRVAQAIARHETRVIDFDLRSYFEPIMKALQTTVTTYGGAGAVHLTGRVLKDVDVPRLNYSQR